MAAMVHPDGPRREPFEGAGERVPASPRQSDPRAAAGDWQRSVIFRTLLRQPLA
jgi:hypothetical protein